MLCFVVVMQSFIMNSHEVFIHIHQGCFAGTGAIVRLPQCQWSKPDGYGKNQSMYNHNKAQQRKNRVHISWDIRYRVLDKQCNDRCPGTSYCVRGVYFAKQLQVRPFQPRKYMAEGTIQYIKWPLPNICVILPNVNINYLDTISVYSRSIFI